MEPKMAFQLILFLKSNAIRTTSKDLEISQRNWIVNMKIQQQQQINSILTCSENLLKLSFK